MGYPPYERQPQNERSSVWIDNPGGKARGIRLHFINANDGDCLGKARYFMTGMGPRQARALAQRILHELDHQDGKRSRRPSNPSLFYDEHLRCLNCGRWDANGPCTNRSNCDFATKGNG